MVIIPLRDLYRMVARENPNRALSGVMLTGMRWDAALVGPAYKPSDACSPSMPGVLGMSGTSHFSLTSTPASEPCLSYGPCGEALYDARRSASGAYPWPL